MYIKKKVTLALVGLLVSGCASGIPGNIFEVDKHVKHVAELLSVKELQELDKEYLQFSTKALTEAYLLKKLMKWKDANNGLKMVKEIDFARQRHPDLFKTLMAANPDLFTFINGMADVSAKKLQSNDFRAFLEGSDPFPAAPENLSADNINTTGFTAHWDAVSGADYYEIVIDSNPPVNVTNVLSYDISGLNGNNHSFKVRTIKNNLTGNFSEAYSVVIPSSPFIFVKANASGLNNGTSWTNAYTSLQTALTNSGSGQEIWIATGTYKPTSNTDRTKSFQLKDGVSVYGGFAGTEENRNERNFNTNIVVLSGDLNNSNSPNDGDSYHVVKGISNSTLDGVNIKFGFSNGSWPNNTGGGMFNENSSPTVSNIIFSNNFAEYMGGGMQNSSSSPTVSNVTFSNNEAGGSGGGGMFNYSSSSPTLSNVIFSNNLASHGSGMSNLGSSPTLNNVIFSNNLASGLGGGMENSFSSPTVTNVTFTSNSANLGGGIYNYNSSPIVSNVTFTSNSASSSGGGIYNDNSSPILTNLSLLNNVSTYGAGMSNEGGSSPTVSNSTFSNNSSSYMGGGIYNDNSSPTITNVTFSNNSAFSYGGGIANLSAVPTIKNSIIWGNTAQNSPGIHNNSSTPTITFSDIQGGYSGTGNISSNPLFVNASDPDGADNIFRTTDDGLNLGNGSPAINTGTNAGAPATDITGVTRPIGNTVDMGAYESEASPDILFSGKIVFVKNNELYLMNGNNSNPRQLTNDGSSKKTPRLRWDGSSIVFGRTDDHFVYSVPTSGTGINTISGPMYYPNDADPLPYYRSNGDYLLQGAGDPHFGNSGIRRIWTQGNVVFSGIPGEINFLGGVRSDGIIVYQQGGTVKRCDFNNNNATITLASGGEPKLALNPTASVIVYGTGSSINTVGLGGGITQLISHSGYIAQPAISPDESKILFVSDQDGSKDIFMMNVNGTEVVNLTNTPTVDETMPDWSN